MIFIATSDATISASVPSMVAQGSILANEVMLLAPFAASTSVTCAFILPNGVRTQEQLAEPSQMVGIDGIPPIKDDLGRYYNAWRYTLDGALTEYAGDVTVQFFFRNGSATLASSASTFNVQAGVPVELPDEPSQDIYDQILRALSSLGARIDQTDANVAGLTTFVNSIYARVEAADLKNAQQDVQIAELQQYKVDRIFPTDETRVYAADPTGDVSFVLSLVPRPLSVPEYDDGGRLESNDPTTPEEVANKRYVDAQNDLDRAYTNSNAVFSVDVSVNPQTYVLTATAKNATGNVLSQSSVDLPLESMVVGAEVVTVGGVDKLRLTLQNGNTVDIDISAIFDGLATEAMLQDGLALKVNKDVNRPAGQTVVYSQSDSGNSAIRVSLVPVADALPQYNPGGRLKTTAPSAANDAVNLEYYNSRVQPLENKVSVLENKVSELEPKVETLEEKSDALRDDVSALEEKAETLETVSRENSEKISRNDKRLTNLESGLVPDPFVTDDSTAYAKDVPTGALRYARVNLVGGMTRLVDGSLVPTPVTEVESVGVNLLSNSMLSAGKNTTVTDGVVVQNIADTNGTIDVKCQGYRGSTFYEDFDSKYAITTGITALVFQKTDNIDRVRFGLNGYTTDTMVDVSVSDLPNGTYTIQANFTNITQGSVSWKDMMINKGATALPYATYFKDILFIHDAVQSIDGYGDGINESYYSYVDLNKKQFVKRVGGVDLSSLTWIKMGSYDAWEASAPANMLQTTGNYDNFICLHAVYVGSSIERTVWNATENTIVANKGKIYCCNKQATNPTGYLYYALVTPEITDISDLITFDNYIEVQVNGTVTMVNDAQAAVPSSITYQIKEGTA